MSDLVVVMHQSRIAQVGSPRALYDAPGQHLRGGLSRRLRTCSPAACRETAGGTAIVAERRTATSFMRRAADGAPGAGAKAALLMRPGGHDVRRAAAVPTARSDQILTGVISDISYHGDGYRLEIAVGDRQSHQVKVARERASASSPDGRHAVVASDAARLLPDDGTSGDDGHEPMAHDRSSPHHRRRQPRIRAAGRLAVAARSDCRAASAAMLCLDRVLLSDPARPDDLAQSRRRSRLLDRDLPATSCRRRFITKVLLHDAQDGRASPRSSRCCSAIRSPTR